MDFKRIIAVCLASLGVSVVMAETTASAIGDWKTVDDVTGRVRSIVKIYETPNHDLAGKIIETFPTPGVIPLKICSACDGARHNQPIIGLVIMEDLKQSDDKAEWKGGHITDPTTGKIYKCNISLSNDNKELHVRGYIGLPLLGRTQTWLRASTH